MLVKTTNWKSTTVFSTADVLKTSFLRCVTTCKQQTTHAELASRVILLFLSHSHRRRRPREKLERISYEKISKREIGKSYFLSDSDSDRMHLALIVVGASMSIETSHLGQLFLFSSLPPCPLLFFIVVKTINFLCACAIRLQAFFSAIHALINCASARNFFSAELCEGETEIEGNWHTSVIADVALNFFSSFSPLAPSDAIWIRFGALSAGLKSLEMNEHLSASVLDGARFIHRDLDFNFFSTD